MEEIEEQIKCRICTSPFLSKCARRRHEKKAHNNVEGKSANCAVCGVLFSNKISMAHHLRAVHRNPILPEYKHKCRHCQTPFKETSTRSSHERNAHRHIEGQSIHCTECNIIFSNVKAYNNHRKHVHHEIMNLNIVRSILQLNSRASGDAVGSSANNLFSCIICGKTYIRKQTCVDHIIEKHSREIEEGPDHLREQAPSSTKSSDRSNEDEASVDNTDQESPSIQGTEDSQRPQ